MLVRFPSLGDQLKLGENWTFPLHSEHRNTSLFAAVGRLWTPWDKWYPQFILDVVTFDDGYHVGQHNKQGWAMVTLPTDTVLQVARIYLRRGCKDFNSITFCIVSTPDVRFRSSIRFWAKLEDCNAMNASWLDQVIPRQKNEPLNKILHMTPPHQREDSPVFGQVPPEWWSNPHQATVKGN